MYDELGKRKGSDSEKKQKQERRQDNLTWK